MDTIFALFIRVVLFSFIVLIILLIIYYTRPNQLPIEVHRIAKSPQFSSGTPSVWRLKLN